MHLTKTGFLGFLHCPEAAWLRAHKPEQFPQAAPSLFDEKLVRDGDEVETYAVALFPGGRPVPSGTDAVAATKTLIADGARILYQPSFLSPQGLFARADILAGNANGSFDLFEVKSSTEVKDDSAHQHVKDACFQKIALQDAGFRIGRVYLIHLNKDFIKDGSVDASALLTIADITDAVAEIAAETRDEIDAALAYLAQTGIDETSCSCLDKTRSNHCEAFGYFNRNLPARPIYQLNNLRPAKLRKLRDAGITGIAGIPDDFPLSPAQSLQVRSVKTDAAIIDKAAIRSALNDLVYPLYFFDYETYAAAVPKIDGTKPHQQVPFQYSLHVLHEDGRLDHHDFIADRLELPSLLIDKMREQIGDTGTLVSWHATFEKQRNNEMAAIYPAAAAFLDDLNRRTFDLETLFKTAYVDRAFDGSTSIKKVLPVLLPQLSYAALDIQDGTSAMEAWFHMTQLDANSPERASLRRKLIAYCTLDTLAMVKIFETLQAEADHE